MLRPFILLSAPSQFRTTLMWIKGSTMLKLIIWKYENWIRRRCLWVSIFYVNHLLKSSTVKMNALPSVRSATLTSGNPRVCFVHKIITRSSAETDDRNWRDELRQGRAGNCFSNFQTPCLQPYLLSNFQGIGGSLTKIQLLPSLPQCHWLFKIYWISH